MYIFQFYHSLVIISSCANGITIVIVIVIIIIIIIIQII
jgi:hypothetical protein